MYQQPQQYQGGPGNGPSMHQQHHHAAPQQQQPARQNYYQAPRMTAPNHQGPRMPHMQNNAPRGPMGQGVAPQPGLNGPPDVGYLGGGNGHIPQVPPTGPPPTPQNQAALSQQQQHQQQHNVYTFAVSQQQQPIIMLHNNHPTLQQVRYKKASFSSNIHVILAPHSLLSYFTQRCFSKLNYVTSSPLKLSSPRGI